MASNSNTNFLFAFRIQDDVSSQGRKNKHSYLTLFFFVLPIVSALLLSPGKAATKRFLPVLWLSSDLNMFRGLLADGSLSRI